MRIFFLIDSLSNDPVSSALFVSKPTNPASVIVSGYFATNLGEIIGKTYFNTMLKNIFLKRYPSLEQEIGGIKFKNPVGLAAGFDYDGGLTQILPSLGFGFETIGTITNLPYKGNPKPRL